MSSPPAAALEPAEIVKTGAVSNAAGKRTSKNQATPTNDFNPFKHTVRLEMRTDKNTLRAIFGLA